MKILQVGSFRGNIGDNANHAGFRPWFQSVAGRSVEWREFEIRNVYRKLAAFDAAFVDAANACDLVVIGGGNYFELWVETSPTGTSFSIYDDMFDRLKAPVFFNALGVDEGQGASPQNLAKFRRFLGRLLVSPQYLVSVRNDGAYGVLQKHVPDFPLAKVLRQPDGGFFAGYGSWQPPGRPGPRIGINLAGDMPERRFPGQNDHSFDSFIDEFAATIADIATKRPDASFVFYPHIFSDLKVYAKLLERLPDTIRREAVEVAAYGAGDNAARAAFGDYLRCDLVLGMRFHANVVPIGHGVPTIGLCCYPQISNLYDELGMPSHCVDVARRGFSAPLQAKVDAMLDAPKAAVAELAAVNVTLSKQRDEAGRALSQWLMTAATPRQAAV